MTTKDILSYLYNKIILPACLVFTIMTIIFVAVMSGDGSEFTAYGMTLSSISQLLLFSFLVAASNRIFEIKEISPFLKVFLHFIAISFTITLTFVWIGKRYLSPRSYLLIAIIYGISFGIYIIINSVKTKNDKKSEGYKRQFR